MPAPMTLVTLVDEDGDSFPIRLPGVYKENRGADIEAALQILKETSEMSPRGEITASLVEYYE